MKNTRIERDINETLKALKFHASHLKSEIDRLLGEIEFFKMDEAHRSVFPKHGAVQGSGCNVDLQIGRLCALLEMYEEDL